MTDGCQEEGERLGQIEKEPRAKAFSEAEAT
jgi:hypothetical protein